MFKQLSCENDERIEIFCPPHPPSSTWQSSCSALCVGITATDIKTHSSLFSLSLSLSSTFPMLCNSLSRIYAIASARFSLSLTILSLSHNFSCPRLKQVHKFCVFFLPPVQDLCLFHIWFSFNLVSYEFPSFLKLIARAPLSCALFADVHLLSSGIWLG